MHRGMVSHILTRHHISKCDSHVTIGDSGACIKVDYLQGKGACVDR